MESREGPFPYVYGLRDIPDGVLMEVLDSLPFQHRSRVRMISRIINSVGANPTNVSFDMRHITTPQWRSSTHSTIDSDILRYKGYIQCLTPPNGRRLDRLLVFGANQRHHYRMRGYLRHLWAGLGLSFPKMVIWANMRIDSVMITHELLQMPPQTQVMLYNISIVGIDWINQPEIEPSPWRHTPYVLSVDSLEILRYDTSLNQNGQDGNHPHHQREFAKEMTRLGNKYAKPLTEDEYECTSSALSFYFDDLKLGDRLQTYGDTVKRLLSKHEPELDVSRLNVHGVPLSVCHLRRLKPLTLRILEAMMLLQS